jgi:hypothetical protein
MTKPLCTATPRATKKKDDNHFLQVQFKGSAQNLGGIGAWADIYYNQGKHQVYENTPFRGYLIYHTEHSPFWFG